MSTRTIRILSLTLSALATAALVPGCGPEFAVVPRGGLERAVATQSGVSMTAFADQWEGAPYDLADYVTPIAVDLYNAGPHEVRVSFAELVLRDEAGTRYPAINPFAPIMGSAIPAQPPLTLYAGPIVLAQRGRTVGPPGGMRSAPPPRYSAPRPGVAGPRIGPPAGIRGYGASRGYRGPAVGWGLYGGGWSGFYLSGGLRGYYGPSAAYWGGPWAYPPYYGTWVYGWGAGWSAQSYPWAYPSADVLALAVPEGVLPPGGRVNGFLYFRNATAQGARALTLSWELHDARSGAALGATQVALDVVNR